MSASVDAVPNIVIGAKSVTCPTCHALIQCSNVDMSAQTLEVIPEEMELHLQWHDRNDR